MQDRLIILGHLVSENSVFVKMCPLNSDNVEQILLKMVGNINYKQRICAAKQGKQTLTLALTVKQCGGIHCIFSLLSVHHFHTF